MRAARTARAPCTCKLEQNCANTSQTLANLSNMFKNEKTIWNLTFNNYRKAAKVCKLVHSSWTEQYGAWKGSAPCSASQCCYLRTWSEGRDKKCHHECSLLCLNLLSHQVDKYDSHKWHGSSLETTTSISIIPKNPGPFLLNWNGQWSSVVLGAIMICHIFIVFSSISDSPSPATTIMWGHILLSRYVDI